MSQSVETLRKLTLKTVCGLDRSEDAKAFMQEQAKSGKELAAISGEVTGYGSKATQYGESFFLSGFFMAVNRQDGKFYKSQKAYLPKDFTETVVAAYKNRGESNDAISFKTIVRVVEDKASATGYAYICEPIATPESTNREIQMMQGLAALPAPVAQKAIASKTKAA